VPFVKFTETGKSFTPKISISSRGLIGFNQGARKRFEIDKYTFCVLYYDLETRRVAFEFSTDEQAEGAIRIRLRSIGADIGAKSFLTFFNILPTATFMYSAQPGDHPNWVVIDLNGGKERKFGSGEEDQNE
jgi:hypothetical protein